MLDRYFQLTARGTDVRTEVVAGVTTFLTMAHIIFVQPAVLSTDLAGRPTGMDLGAVLHLLYRECGGRGGGMMLRSARRIEWDDPSEAVPVFLTIAGIPLSSSIADGLALGLVAYPPIKLLGGRGRAVHWLACVIAVLLVAYFLLVRNRLG